MIDFRYHLVSLVAVFLALAVGIVMGAGPLRESLGEQLTEQVEALRLDRDHMRAENERISREHAVLANFVAASNQELVAGTLDSRSVLIIADETALSSHASAMQGVLEAAGANVTGHITLHPSLWDPALEDHRSRTITHLVETWPALNMQAPSTSAHLASIITLVNSEAFPITVAERTEISSLIIDNGFMTSSVATVLPASGLVYAQASQDALAIETDSPENASARSALSMDASQAVVDTARDRMAACVVGINNPVAANSDGMVRALRAQGSETAISTIDGLGYEGAPALAALALAASFRSQTGHYGFATDASAVLPPVAPLREATPDAPAPEGDEG